MEQRKKIIPIVILLVVLLVGYLAYSRFVSGNADANSVSGYIEGEETAIAAEVAGRIETITVDEGDRVTAGQELIRLDRAMLDAQIFQAQAALDTAKAQNAQVRAGTRVEDIRQAEAAVAQAVAARDGAKRAWENAQAVRASPQELDARIATAQTLVNTTKYQLEAATASAVSAATRKDAIGGAVAAVAPEQKVVVNNWWAAEAQALAAKSAAEGAEKGLQILLDMRNRPLALDAQVDVAKTQYDTANTAVDIAQARLEAMKAGATKEQLVVSDTAVKQAEAALGILQVQSTKMIMKSPVNGMVSRRAVRVGEIATPNSPLINVTNLDSVKLTIYVPETQIGQIKIGDEISIKVDSFPNKFFKGKVIFINTQAEFTPRNVQTKAERVNTVFAVRLLIPNPNQELKPGMPADASLK
jgi:HlyD family secretion protein